MVAAPKAALLDEVRVHGGASGRGADRSGRSHAYPGVGRVGAERVGVGRVGGWAVRLGGWAGGSPTGARVNVISRTREPRMGKDYGRFDAHTRDKFEVRSCGKL